MKSFEKFLKTRPNLTCNWTKINYYVVCDYRVGNILVCKKKYLTLFKSCESQLVTSEITTNVVPKIIY